MNVKNTKKILVFLGATLLVLVAMFAFTFTGQEITGEVISEYVHTRAICDENNLCQDYEIVCEGNKVLDITPTGFIVQNPEDWEDPRSLEDIEQWCNVSR